MDPQGVLFQVIQQSPGSKEANRVKAYYYVFTNELRWLVEHCRISMTQDVPVQGPSSADTNTEISESQKPQNCNNM